METLINETVTTSEQTTNEQVSNDQSTTTLINETQTEDQSNQATTSNADAVETKLEYADFTLPEGFQLEEAIGSEFKAIAGELKLNQEQAQKLIDMHAKHAVMAQEKLDTEFKGIVSKWREESVAHFGKELKSEITFVAKALDQFGSPELRTLLNETGLGNNKDVIRLLAQVGRKISDDSMVSGNNGASAEISFAKKMYPNMN